MHPKIALAPVNMEHNVSKMVMKATSALEAQLKKQENPVCRKPVRNEPARDCSVIHRTLDYTLMNYVGIDTWFTS